MRPLLALLIGGFLLQAPPPPDTEVGGLIWLGREAEVEEAIRTAPIARIDDVPVGVTRPRRAFFEPGWAAASGVLKDLPPRRRQGYWESYLSEIAAYELDKLLALRMVPPTVERRVDGRPMSLQLWVDNASLLKELSGERSPDVVTWNRQVYRQRVFDNLIANIDRNSGNLLVVRNPDWHLVLIDHSRAFAPGVNRMPFEMTRIDRPLFQRLKALEEPELQAQMGKLINGGGVRALLERRDDIVEHFEKLAAERGDAVVFIP